MIAVFGGTEPWTDEEARHLATCADCRAEWRLVQHGARLGSAVPAPLVDRVIDGVRARLASAAAAERRAVQPIRAWRRSRRWIIGLAAAAVLILAVRFTASRSSDAVEPTAILTELEELTATELETVLGDLETAGPADDGRLGDLDADELERVLQAWES
jgi:hypothetical protein